MYIFAMVAAVPLLALLLSATPANSSQSFEQIARQADAARQGDHVQLAIELYGEGVRLRPEWSEGWWELGSLYYDQDRFPEAEASFKRFAAKAPKPGPAYAFLGLCEYENREYDRSLEHFRLWATKGWGGTPELIDVAVFHFALLLTREGRFVESLYLLATEVQRRGSSPALAEAMGLASLRLKNLPEDYPPEQREKVWLAGNSAVYSALPPVDFAHADEFAHRLVQHYDIAPNVHYFLGTLLNYEGKKAEGEKEFRREIEIAPQNTAALLELARMDLEGNQLDEAGNFARQAVDLEPKNADAHHVLGRVLLATDKLPESVKELETAKQLAPDGATIRSHLAMAYSRSGRKDEAKAEMAAFTVLKEKEGVFVPPAEKTRSEKRAGAPK